MKRNWKMRCRQREGKRQNKLRITSGNKRISLKRSQSNLLLSKRKRNDTANVLI